MGCVYASVAEFKLPPKAFQERFGDCMNMQHRLSIDRLSRTRSRSMSFPLLTTDDGNPSSSNLRALSVDALAEKACAALR